MHQALTPISERSLNLPGPRFDFDIAVHVTNSSSLPIEGNLYFYDPPFIKYLDIRTADVTVDFYNISYHSHTGIAIDSTASHLSQLKLTEN